MKKKIASKKVKKADRRDKEREEGRREEEKGKTGCVRVESTRFFVTVIAGTLCCLYAHGKHNLKRRSPHACTVTSQIPLKPLCSTL